MSYQHYLNWKNVPIQDEPLLSIIIPAYNESERIIPTIGAIAAHVSTLGFAWELLVVDDGSRDDTAELVEALELQNLRLIRSPHNEGKGGAVQRGMLAAHGHYLLFADADNSTPVEEITKLLAKVQQDHFDIAVGSRAADGAQEASRSWFRLLLSHGLRTMVRYAFNFSIRDTQCGFKLFTRETARRLHSAQTIKGFSFDLEVLYLASKLGYSIAEVPVAWIDAPGSKVDSTKEIRRFLRDLLKIKWNDLKGAYAHA